MRFPHQRLADLRAQAAANRTGALRLSELAERHGVEHLRTAMQEVLAYAERPTRAALSDLPDGTYRAEDFLENDTASVASYREAPAKRNSGSVDGPRDL